MNDKNYIHLLVVKSWMGRMQYRGKSICFFLSGKVRDI